MAVKYGFLREENLKPSIQSRKGYGLSDRRNGIIPSARFVSLRQSNQFLVFLLGFLYTDFNSGILEFLAAKFC